MLSAELESAAELLEAAERETKRSGKATIYWVGPFTVEQAYEQGRGKKGLYIIYDNGKSVDSGKAEKQDLRSRLIQHFDSYRRKNADLSLYTVSLGFIKRSSSINLAEGTVTRTLAKALNIPEYRKSDRTGRMQRVPNTAPFRAIGRGVQITHLGAIPKELSLNRSRGRRVVQKIPRSRGSNLYEFSPSLSLAESDLENELDRAAANLEFEDAEPFFTKVTPIPGIGNKEGHEILTRLALRGLPVSPSEQSAIELGVIRPDRGGRSYWNFPRTALESLKAGAQPAHSLRPTPSSTIPAALRLIHKSFIGLYRRAMHAKTRKEALEWLGEALHLLQDSFSRAHVERVGGTGRIRHIRAFYIRIGWPPLSRAPHEHNAPSDPRDDVYLHGGLRPEAMAAVKASRDFLVMALRHLRVSRSPRNRIELLTFIRRYLS